MYDHPCEWAPTHAGRVRGSKGCHGNVKVVLIVEVKIIHNQDVPGFDDVVLKKVLELTRKEANTTDLFLFDGGGRYITTSFTAEEELSVTSMFSNDIAFHEDFDVIFIFDLCMMATPLPLAVVFMCCLLGTWVKV